VGRCVFDIGMPIFASSAFHRQQTAAMDALKVAVGKFVSGFAVRGMSFVNTKMPFRVLSKAVEANKFVFLVGRRLIRFPESFVVRNEASLADQLRACSNAATFSRTVLLLLRASARPGGTGSRITPTKASAANRDRFGFMGGHFDCAG